jgi:hypothetical protein
MIEGTEVVCPQNFETFPLKYNPPILLPYSVKQIIRQNTKQSLILTLNPYAKQLLGAEQRNEFFILSLLQTHSVISLSMGDHNKPEGTVHSSERAIRVTLK